MKTKAILFSWIEACLQYGGAFGPREKTIYRQIFGLSEPSASRHQAEFAEIYESRCDVAFARTSDHRLQGGRLTPLTELPAKPLFEQMPSLERWLEDCFGNTRFFNVEVPRREPEPWIMRAIIQSLHSQTPVEIDYHSRNSDSRRIVSPHALVKIAGRLHMRAFDHSRNVFADFVLSRVTAARLSPQTVFIGNRHDTAWHSFETLTVQAKKHQGDQRLAKGVQLDFGLDATGMRRVRVRQPFVQYLVDDMDDAYTAPVEIRRSEESAVPRSAFSDNPSTDEPKGRV